MHAVCSCPTDAERLVKRVRGSFLNGFWTRRAKGSARSSIRPTRVTLTASASRARWQASSTRSAPYFLTSDSSRYTWRIRVQGSGESRSAAANSPTAGPC